MSEVLNVTYVEGTPTTTKKLIKANPNSRNQRKIATLPVLNLNAPFAYFRGQSEKGSQVNEASEWRKALAEQAKKGGTHPSGHEYTELHFETGAINEQSVIWLAVGRPTPRKVKKTEAQ